MLGSSACGFLHTGHPQYVGEEGESGGLLWRTERAAAQGEDGGEGADESLSLLSPPSLILFARFLPTSSSCSRLCLEATAAPVFVVGGRERKKSEKDSEGVSFLSLAMEPPAAPRMRVQRSFKNLRRVCEAVAPRAPKESLQGKRGRNERKKAGRRQLHSYSPAVAAAQPQQKRCPHERTTGCDRRSRQTGHE